MTKSLAGRCACGAVSFTAISDDFWVGYCHCHDCSKATGAPVSAYVGVKAANVVFQGAPKKFATSDGVSRAWCERCGTPISYESTRWPGEIHFHIGLFDHPEDFAPQGHTYTNEQLPWFEISDDLPRSEKPGN